MDIPSTHSSGTGSGDSAANASGVLDIVITNDIPLVLVQQTGNGINQAFFFYGTSTDYTCRIEYNETASSNVRPEITMELDGC